MKARGAGADTTSLLYHSAGFRRCQVSEGRQHVHALGPESKSQRFGRALLTNTRTGGAKGGYNRYLFICYKGKLGAVGSWVAGVRSEFVL